MRWLRIWTQPLKVGPVQPILQYLVFPCDADKPYHLKGKIVKRQNNYFLLFIFPFVSTADPQKVESELRRLPPSATSSLPSL
ncbi:hypothetical protein LINPERPRIM_LOCUS14970 [Linum perenne]